MIDNLVYKGLPELIDCIKSKAAETGHTFHFQARSARSLYVHLIPFSENNIVIIREDAVGANSFMLRSEFTKKDAKSDQRRYVLSTKVTTAINRNNKLQMIQDICDWMVHGKLNMDDLSIVTA